MDYPFDQNDVIASVKSLSDVELSDDILNSLLPIAYGLIKPLNIPINDEFVWNQIMEMKMLSLIWINSDLGKGILVDNFKDLHTQYNGNAVNQWEELLNDFLIRYGYSGWRIKLG
ncbi:hypothetical protein FAM21835_02079 [Lentilactobacillus parabuchneri]|uniref:hypothetical protein n=1 Tax=Lentilactobacillus parabuchneri TaxID=152331 RepID=UPI0007F95B01|nr:hypothetical protein [Lentilactobacillus parabuchneri]OBU97818.1 hypothetical protein A7B51_00135 [Lentilactobacillus parabuchneri]ORN25101.1 hypothetical protein FAM21835_02079 [Lentilactobacillus parabuchneri]